LTYKNHTIKTLHPLLVIALLSIASICQAEFAGEFLLFPQLETTRRANLDSNLAFDQSDYGASVDFFMTFENRNFRFLGEFLLSNEEQEFERFQLGWSYNSHLFWLCLFHNPIGYWNTSYHHGAYLQTSISRPAIIGFEDHDGILPIHLAGFLAEGTIEPGERELGYTLALASGPEYDDALEPWNALKPGVWAGDTSATLNLYHDFGSKIPTRIGLFLNSTQIPTTLVGVDEIQQIITGLYGNWEFPDGAGMAHPSISETSLNARADRKRVHFSTHFCRRSSTLTTAGLFMAG